jgi:hypothetical protein
MRNLQRFIINKDPEWYRHQIRINDIRLILVNICWNPIIIKNIYIYKIGRVYKFYFRIHEYYITIGACYDSIIFGDFENHEESVCFNLETLHTQFEKAKKIFNTIFCQTKIDYY